MISSEVYANATDPTCSASPDHLKDATSLLQVSLAREESSPELGPTASGSGDDTTHIRYGQRSDARRFPFVILFRITDQKVLAEREKEEQPEYTCTGSLIGKKYAISAKHCFKDNMALVRSGALVAYTFIGGPNGAPMENKLLDVHFVGKDVAVVEFAQPIDHLLENVPKGFAKLHFVRIATPDELQKLQPDDTFFSLGFGRWEKGADRDGQPLESQFAITRLTRTDVAECKSYPLPDLLKKVAYQVEDDDILCTLPTEGIGTRLTKKGQTKPVYGLAGNIMPGDSGGPLVRFDASTGSYVQFGSVWAGDPYDYEAPQALFMSDAKFRNLICAPEACKNCAGCTIKLA